MAKSKSFISILIPSATVFISSACIMVIEIVAGRLIARHLGSSLYTWTSVIGVVLAGITIGNYIGGRIADRFPARKALAILFGFASIACVGIVMLNNLVGDWVWLWRLNWSTHVFTHVALVFLIPSTLLGTISPVVAKMALDIGFPTGRTVGDIYAWGAAGSIVGTFLAGFYLIATMGTIAIIWTVGGVLLLLGILYWARLWLLYIWAAFFICLMAMGTMPFGWVQDTGVKLALRKAADPQVVYEDETHYCYVAVKQLTEKPDKRVFMQDKLKHSEVIMGDINNLQYFHTVIFAAITHGLVGERETFSVFNIGGGGYVFPQYAEKNWPGSRIDVVEIDSRVTKAAMEAFGLKKDTTINTITMDARNYVDELLRQEQDGESIVRYDFIYEDAISDYSVPYQLVTREFNDKIFKLLTNDGVYLINSIDIYNSALFVGSFVHTLKETFPYVYVVTEIAPSFSRRVFVTIASKKEIDVSAIISNYRKGLDFRVLDNSEIETIMQKSGNILLTDDFVPVENMLAPVVRQSALDFLAAKYKNEAKELKKQGKFEESIAKYEQLIKIQPAMSVLAYNDIGIMKLQLQKPQEAVEAFRKAVEYNEQVEIKTNIAGVHLNLAVVLRKLKETSKSEKQFRMAIEGFKQEIYKNSDSLEAIIKLARTLVEVRDYEQAAKYFQQAVNKNPYDIRSHLMLSQALEAQGKFDEAVSGLKKAIKFISQLGQKESTTKLQKYLEFVEFKKAKQQKQIIVN